MYCKICGTHRTVEYRRGPRMNLCDHCAIDTPKKASYANFNKRYWDTPEIVSQSIKLEFYSDYKASRCTVDQYIEQTTDYIY